MDWTSIVLGGLTLLGGCAWFVNFRKDKQEAKGIRADNRQKEMDLSKMYVDEEGGLSVLCLAGCASTKQASEVSSSKVQVSSVETRDTVREQVMVAVHDTIREVTTITVQTNDAGDTLKVVQITDRDRARNREAVRDKEERLVVRTDTVYVEKRDSVYVQTNTALTNPTNTTKGSGFRATLKWILAIAFLLLASVVLVRARH